VQRRSAGDRSEMHSIAAPHGLIPALKGGVSARERVV
jgi:hypothetical protein